MNLDIIISIKIDSNDRLNNLDITMEYIKTYFDCNVILVEQNNIPIINNRYDCNYIFEKTDQFFNRQRGLNIGVKHSSSNVIAHYDADILLNPIQLITAVRLIEDGSYDMIYPYDGNFYDVPKSYHENIIFNLSSIPLENCKLFNSNSVGGVVVFNKQKFIEGGGANENFKGLGYEDNEIYDRYTKLKYNIARIQGPLYHLNHERKETAYDNNPYINDNINEYKRISNMSQSQLIAEISSWKFI